METVKKPVGAKESNGSQAEVKDHLDKLKQGLSYLERIIKSKGVA